MQSRTQSGSPYIEYSKLHSGAKFNLAASGVLNYPLAELGVRIQDLEINGSDSYGYPPLLDRLARYNQVPPHCVVAAAGTSMANHLALAATLDPGDEILIEQPTYEVIESVARYLGATVRYFPRRFENQFRVDPEEVRKLITSRTRLIAITNLHNPSGAHVNEDTLRAVGDIAKERGARVLVDEVYLEMLYEQRPLSAFHLGHHFLVTSSLTKAFGLGGLRCGWVLVSPELAQRMWRINDLYGALPAHAADLLSVIALDQLDTVAARAHDLLKTNRQELLAFLDSRDDIACSRPDHGTICFPKLLSSRVDKLCRLLREKYETSVMPGEQFGMTHHFRVGIGGETEMVREGLHRLGLALDELRAR